MLHFSKELHGIFLIGNQVYIGKQYYFFRKHFYFGDYFSHRPVIHLSSKSGRVGTESTRKGAASHNFYGSCSYISLPVEKIPPWNGLIFKREAFFLDIEPFQFFALEI